VECPVTFLYTSELIAANPMQLVGRPKLAKTLPKALPAGSVAALLAKLNTDPQPRRRSDWVERDRALILTALLAGLRANELLRANVGDLRRSDDGAVIHVRGKSGKDRRVPIEPALVEVLERYLGSRATRFPATVRQRSPGRGLAVWPPAAALYVGADGERIRRGTLQYLRDRARQRRGQRLHADEANRPRIHGDFAALRHCTRYRNPHCRSPEQAVRLIGKRSLIEQAPGLVARSPPLRLIVDRGARGILLLPNVIARTRPHTRAASSISLCSTGIRWRGPSDLHARRCHIPQPLWRAARSISQGQCAIKPTVIARSGATCARTRR
jgi:Phage integrase family